MAESTDIPPSSTIDFTQWLRSREGIAIRTSSTPECAYCGGRIEKGDRTQHYASTLDLTAPESHGTLRLQRHYCPTCRRDEITYHCAGVYEVLIEHRVGSKYRLSHLEQVAVSARDAGHRWAPEAVCRSVLNRSPAELAVGGRTCVGPEHVVDALAYYGLSPELVIKADGGPIAGDRLREAHEQIALVTEHLAELTDEEQRDWLRAQPYPPTGLVDISPVETR